jgi:hypothetical protein
MEGIHRNPTGQQIKDFYQGWIDGLSSQPGMHPALYLSESQYEPPDARHVKVGPQLAAPLFIAETPILHNNRTPSKPRNDIQGAPSVYQGGFIYYYADFGDQDPNSNPPTYNLSTKYGCSDVQQTEEPFIRSLKALYNSIQWKKSDVECAP